MFDLRHKEIQDFHWRDLPRSEGDCYSVLMSAMFIFLLPSGGTYPDQKGTVTFIRRAEVHHGEPWRDLPRSEGDCYNIPPHHIEFHLVSWRDLPRSEGDCYLPDGVFDLRRQKKNWRDLPRSEGDCYYTHTSLSALSHLSGGTYPDQKGTVTLCSWIGYLLIPFSGGTYPDQKGTVTTQLHVP